MMKYGLIVVALMAVASCSKKNDGAPPPADDKMPKPTDDKTAKPEPTEKPVAVEPKLADPAAPPAAMVELDLSPLGKQFAGYVAMAPAGAKAELDDPSRHIVLSETESITIGEAPFWEDSIKTLPTDKDNSNIKQVSATEVRYERNPPLGKAWNVDILIKIGKEKWSCGTLMGGTFKSAAMADQIAATCNSIKKK